MPQAMKRKRSERAKRPRAAAIGQKPRRTAAAASPMSAEPFRLDRGQRMLEVGSHMITYYMFLSHQLLPLAGEADGVYPEGSPRGAADASNSSNRFAGQFNEVRRCLLRVVGHHPVLRGKIERVAEETERMLADASRYPAGHPTRQTLQREARALCQRLRENSRAMSDLVAVLRNV
ncbi:MAG: hypothetical protein AB1515_00815 [Nitrospirota bacterium]